jgi:hypothetical protein
VTGTKNLETWITDDAKAVAADSHEKLQQANAQGVANGGFRSQCRRRLAGHALVRYRDELRQTERLREEVRLSERSTHRAYRWIKRRSLPGLEAPTRCGDVIAEWRDAHAAEDPPAPAERVA